MPTLEEIKQTIFQLPIQKQIILMEDSKEKLETLQMMQFLQFSIVILAILLTLNHLPSYLLTCP